jgi:hypothetical protein
MSSTKLVLSGEKYTLEVARCRFACCGVAHPLLLGQVALPRAVKDTEAKASFNKAQKRLVVKLPIL